MHRIAACIQTLYLRIVSLVAIAVACPYIRDVLRQILSNFRDEVQKIQCRHSQRIITTCVQCILAHFRVRCKRHTCHDVIMPSYTKYIIS